MTAGKGAPIRRIAALMLAGALALAGCGGSGSGTPRPTDPRQILVNAIAATAALPTLRIHAEIGSTMGGLGQPNQVMTMAIDADVDLANRQFTGRATTQMPGGNGIGLGQQAIDMIVTQTGSFSRNPQSGRWMKTSAMGLGGGPTNVQIATMITNLLSNPAVTYQLSDASPCTLGTCDHVVAHISGQTLGAALAPLTGQPLNDQTQAMVPDFDVDVLVDQATSVISELRTGYSMQGTSARILVQLTNPGQPVQIAQPPAALIDDFSDNSGGFGPTETTILEQVGNELESSDPTTPEPAPAVP
jgi:hypothetical protein